MSIVVYTCITGNYEEPKDNQVFEGADFYIFSSAQFEHPHWKRIGATKMFSNPRRNARYHKLIPHEFFPKYDYHIWIDGSVELKVPATTLVDYLNTSGADIVTLRHPVRTCAYQEALECMKLKLDDEVTLNYHVDKLLKRNYPEDNGLAETKVVIRRNTDRVAAFNGVWLYELMTGTLRDQVSFNYAAWKTGVKVAYLEPLLNGESEWFKYNKHKRLNLVGQIV